MSTRIRIRCDYEIVGTEDGIIFLRDLNFGRMSVTNDAEAVVEHIKFQYGRDARIVYQDSEGEWSEIVRDFGPYDIPMSVHFKPWHGMVWDKLSRVEQ